MIQGRELLEQLASALDMEVTEHLQKGRYSVSFLRGITHVSVSAAKYGDAGTFHLQIHACAPDLAAKICRAILGPSTL